MQRQRYTDTQRLHQGSSRSTLEPVYRSSPHPCSSARQHSSQVHRLRHFVSGPRFQAQLYRHQSLRRPMRPFAMSSDQVVGLEKPQNTNGQHQPQTDI
jgi:hypothetical protein